MNGKNLCAKEIIAIDVRALMHGKNTGVEVYCQKIIDNLLSIKNTNNYEFIFFYSGLFKKDWSKYNWSKAVVHIRFPNKLLNIFLSIFSFPKIDRLLEKKIKKNISKIFLPDIRPIAIKNAELITVFHDLSFERFPEFFTFKTRFWHKILNPKHIANISNKIIAVSNFTARELETLYKISANKIQVIYEGPGITSSFSQAQEVKFIKKFNLKNPYFVFLSSIEPRKNLINSIEAFKIFKRKNSNFDFVILGTKNNKIFNNVNFIGGGGIRFLGEVTDIEKTVILKNSQALVYCSLYEGFGLPILEAYSCGLPVITSNNSATAEVCGKAAITVSAKNVKEIREAMFKIIKSEERKILIQNIPDSLKNFSWEKAAQKTLDYFSFSK